MRPTARMPPRNLPGLDPAWSRVVSVPGDDGASSAWHVLDNRVSDPVGTLLCVHGNPTWSYLWRRLLAGPPAGWRVVAPDQLGMGWSERPVAPRRLAQRVADLGALTTALGVRGPVVTLAHDWGGPISLGWALAHRDQVAGVVLANTALASPGGDRGPVLIRLAHRPGLRAAVCVRSPLFVRSATALSRPPLPEAVRGAFAAPYRSAARRRAVGDFVADIPFRPDHPSRPTLEAIAEGARSLDVPGLLLWGPRDPVFGERHLRDLRARLPRADLHRFEGASHLLPEDAPEYADVVAAWAGDRIPTDTTARRVPSSPAAGIGAPAASWTLWSALEGRAGDPSPAVVEVGGTRVPWSLLARRVREIAGGLAAAGVRPGHRVALLVPPSAELTAAVYAVWRAGAVVVVADRGLGFAGMRRALRSAAVDHVVGTVPGLAAARLMGLPGSRFAAGTAPRRLHRAVGAQSGLADLARLGRRAALPPEPGTDQECAVLFTSGATGPAKGVVYRHAQALAQLELVRSTYALTDQDRLVAAFAPFALLGPALGIGSAVPDVDVTAPGTLTAADLADAAAAVAATVVFASPAALRNVAATAHRLSARQRQALNGVRLLMSAGAPVPARLLRAVEAVVPRAEAHTPYGMTEVLPVTDVSRKEVEAAGPGNGICVGHPLPGVEVAVSPLSETGAAEGPLTALVGVTGEVCVRAAHVKDRYDGLWATERAAARDPGWHRTADVGHLDGEGRLWIEGRLAHVITTARGVVTPVGVEQRVESLGQVDTAAVVGVGPTAAQVVVVVLVPAGSRRRQASARSRAADPRLADLALANAVRQVAQVAVAAVLVVPALPLDIRHASKIDRREVARRAARFLAGERAVSTDGPRP